MKKFLLLGVVALLLAGATDSYAQRRNRGLRINDSHEGQRIRRGIRFGQITGEEDRLLRRRSYNNLRNDRRRGNGYYRRGAGSPTHPVFGLHNPYHYRHRHRFGNY